MKDVTIALELTVDDDVTDADIQYFVQKWLKKSIRECGTPRFNHDLIDVRAIHDGTYDYDRSEWRDLEFNHGPDY